MLETITFTEAKAKLSEIFDRVEAGGEVIVTRHNQPVGRIVPEKRRDNARIKHAVERLIALQTGPGASLEEIIAWKNEGRR
jgi:prevent-host-death family protein